MQMSCNYTINSQYHYTKEDIEDILHYYGVEQKGKLFQCISPEHQDNNPSMSVGGSSGSRCRAKCFACDKSFDPIDIITTLRPSMSKLEASQELRDVFGMKDILIEGDSTMEYARVKTEQEHKDLISFVHNAGTLIETYRYNHKYYKHKILQADGKKCMAPSYYCDKQDKIVLCKYNIRGNRDFLTKIYRPNKIDINKTLFITEGEKDCTNMIAAGFKNTISLDHGAEGYKELNKMLSGRKGDIIIVMDVDSAGIKKAQSLAQALIVGKNTYDIEKDYSNASVEIIRKARESGLNVYFYVPIHNDISDDLASINREIVIANLSMVEKKSNSRIAPFGAIELKQRGKRSISVSDIISVVLDLYKGVLATCLSTNERFIVKAGKYIEFTTQHSISIFEYMKSKFNFLLNRSELNRLLEDAFASRKINIDSIKLEKIETDDDEEFNKLIARFPQDGNKLSKELLKEMFIIWMLGFVRPTLELDKPVIHDIEPHKLVLMISSGHGRGKSSFFSNFFIGTSFQGKSIAIDNFDTTNKDNVLEAMKSFIVELPEQCSATGKKAVEGWKSFISKDKDSVREPYATHPFKKRRATVFVNTLNYGKPLHDTSGNSRFGIIPLDNTANYLPRPSSLNMNKVIGYIVHLAKKNMTYTPSQELQAYMKQTGSNNLDLHPITERIVENIKKQQDKTSMYVYSKEEIITLVCGKEQLRGKDKTIWNQLESYLGIQYKNYKVNRIQKNGYLLPRIAPSLFGSEIVQHVQKSDASWEGNRNLFYDDETENNNSHDNDACNNLELELRIRDEKIMEQEAKIRELEAKLNERVYASNNDNNNSGTVVYTDANRSKVRILETEKTPKQPVRDEAVAWDIGEQILSPGYRKKNDKNNNRR